MKFPPLRYLTQTCITVSTVLVPENCILLSSVDRNVSAKIAAVHNEATREIVTLDDETTGNTGTAMEEGTYLGDVVRRA